MFSLISNVNILFKIVHNFQNSHIAYLRPWQTSANHLLSTKLHHRCLQGPKYPSEPFSFTHSTNSFLLSNQYQNAVMIKQKLLSLNKVTLFLICYNSNIMLITMQRKIYDSKYYKSIKLKNYLRMQLSRFSFTLQNHSFKFFL